MSQSNAEKTLMDKAVQIHYAELEGNCCRSLDMFLSEGYEKK
jgi:hypothetical protein